MDRRAFLLGSLAAGGLAACSSSSGGPAASPSTTAPAAPATSSAAGARSVLSGSRPNVLFLSIDDLNDWVGYLGVNPSAATPNLDALRRESISFDKAYCTAPVCLASRASVMYGAMPHSSGVYNHDDPSSEAYKALKETAPSLPEQMSQAGYTTVGAGKIFHDTVKKAWDRYRQTKHYVNIWARDDYEPPRFDPEWLSPYTGAPIGDGGDRTHIDFGPSGVSVDEEPDAKAARWIVDQLDSGLGEPFFVGYGNYLPHLPWRVPQKYLDMHPVDEVAVPEVRPEDLDDISPVGLGWVDPADMLEGLLDEGLLREAVQGYLAAISFADDMVGRILDALMSGPYADNTAVVLWSDHGYHMGEKMHIRKFTLWERATRVPLLMRFPDGSYAGETFDRPVSLLDLGPTIVDIGGAAPHEAHEGRSLLPVIDSPESADERPPVMTWRENNHSIRQGDWRYIRYRDGSSELYDHATDPEEYTNLLTDPSYWPVVAELNSYLPEPVPSPPAS